MYMSLSLSLSGSVSPGGVRCIQRIRLVLPSREVDDAARQLRKPPSFLVAKRLKA